MKTHKIKKTEFDLLSDDYEKTLKKSFPALLEEVSYFTSYKIKLIYDLNKKKKNINILDFGCGAGSSLKIIPEYFKFSEFWGYDVSKKFINKIKKQNKKFKLTSNLKKIPTKKFDLILISNVLHHVDKKNHCKILSYCRKFLNDSGVLYIFEHNPINPLTNYVFKNTPIDKNAEMIHSKKLISNALKAKLKIINLKYTLFFPKQLFFLRFLEKFLSWLPLGAQYLLILRK
jgi:2-polyprenyl-3-methyl-5-hydroxy-6-metoxy-1,4-benzoquinol methylase